MSEPKIKKLKNLNSSELIMLRFQDFFESIGENMEHFNQALKTMQRQMDSMVASDENKLYSPSEVAKLLSTPESQIHRNTVLRWISENKLAYLDGTKYKIPGKAIKAFVNTNTKYKRIKL